MAQRYLKFPAVDKFDGLSSKNAASVLYDSLIPFCEKKGVYLSSYGNHNAPRSLFTVKEYLNRKSRNNLFNIKGVQCAFHFIGTLFQPSSHYHTSYKLKGRLEVHPTYTKDRDSRYITNGDVTAALLLKGLRAQYVCQGIRSVNLRFKVKICPPKAGANHLLRRTGVAPTNLSAIYCIRTPKCWGNKYSPVIHFFQRKCVKCRQDEEIEHFLLAQKIGGKHIIVYKCDKCGVVWYYSAEDLPIRSTKGFHIITLPPKADAPETPSGSPRSGSGAPRRR